MIWRPLKQRGKVRRDNQTTKYEKPNNLTRETKQLSTRNQTTKHKKITMIWRPLKQRGNARRDNQTTKHEKPNN